MTLRPEATRAPTLRTALFRTGLVAVAFGLFATVAATASEALAITLAAAGGAATLWLLQAAILGLSDPHDTRSAAAHESRARR